MSFVDEIIKDKPSKYETILKSRILSKKLKFKINEYDTIQSQYDKLIQQETANRKPASGGNESLKGRLKQLSAAGKDWLWGVNSSDAIWTCKKPCLDSNWIKIPGGLTQIEGGDKEVWGVNAGNNIYKMNQDHSNNWKYIPGKLSNISQGGGWVWGVNSSNNVYRCKQPCDGKWILDTIKEDTGGSIASKEECGNAAAKIYGNSKVFKTRNTQSGDWSWVPPGCTVQSGGDWAPHWNTRSGTCKSSSVYTCVENKAPVNDDWILVFRQTNNDWNWTKNNGGNRNIVNDNAANYSQLQNLENFRGDDGKLTFLMTYPANKTLTSPQIWKQKSNPWTVRNNRNGQVDGYEAISVPYRGDSWGGLRWNGGPCLLSGSTNSWWWYALGSFKPFGNNLIPGANETQVNKTELYVKNKKNSNQGPSLVQLSCSNTHVYGLDTNKRAWRKNIDGSGEWSRFGNPWGWQFLHINASSSNGKILAVDMSRRIRETDKNGTSKWKRSSSAGEASGINTVSGDSQNEDFYFTNTNDQIYRNSPITSGGYWTDIKNENYGFEMVDFKQSNSNWKYLGQSNNITDCKIKAVEDKKNEYSSIVYTTGTSGINGVYNKSCYGGIKGGNTNPTYVKGITTSLAPNGTSRLGGSEGTKLLKRMKNIHNDIEDLVKEQNKDTDGIKKVSNVIRKEKDDRSKELEQLLEKLQKDRIQINKLLNEPSAMAGAEDANDRQSSSYIIMLLWILVVIISIVLAGHLYTTDSENISPITYIFVGVWTIIFCTYYYRKFTQYGNTGWDSLSDALTSDTP